MNKSKELGKYCKNVSTLQQGMQKFMDAPKHQEFTMLHKKMPDNNKKKPAARYLIAE